MTASLLIALEFRSLEALLPAIERAKAVGGLKLDALTPFPCTEIADALGEGTSRIAWITGLSALAGGLIMAATQWYAGHAYPLDLGGRPVFPWPAFVSTVVIVAILWAALGAFVGLFALLNLPRLHHPAFDIPGFRQMWDGHFYLLIEPGDRTDAIESLIASVDPAAVHRLPV